jgi:GNAT superfamily N-acetyltransferase
MEEKYTNEQIEGFIDDFIIKWTIFGLFENNVLAGIIILDYGREFKIDESPNEKVKTFYIQELIVDDTYRGKGYGNLLINYSILRCPKDIKYISYMTMPSNTNMIKIARKFNFKLQELPSGDKKHSLLYIRKNDRVERSLYEALSFYKSISGYSSLGLSSRSSSSRSSSSKRSPSRSSYSKSSPSRSSSSKSSPSKSSPSKNSPSKNFPLKRS